MKLFGYLAFLALLFSVYGCNETTEVKDIEKTDSSVSKTADWKLGVQLWTFRFFTFTEAINKVDSAGIRYVEAFVGQPLGGGMKDSFGLNMSADSKSKVKQLLQQKNISIVAMGVIAPQTIIEWNNFFELAKEFGLSYVTAEPRKDQWKSVDSLAGVYNIKVAIHNHPKPSQYWHPDSVLAAAQGNSNIGSCADLGHWPRSGLNPVECLKKLEGHVFGVHLKDIVKFDDVDAADTIVGKGIIDYPAVFKELERQHFKGMLSIEHESNWYNSLPDIIETKRYYEEQTEAIK